MLKHDFIGLKQNNMSDTTLPKTQSAQDSVNDKPEENPFGVHITVKPHFLADESTVDKGEFLFAYEIRIANLGKVPVQLISRVWHISDAKGQIDVIRGLGVVGQQPMLKPNEAFEYTSGCPLPTPVGSMRGSFFFVTEQDQRFDVPVAEFVLAMPRTLH